MISYEEALKIITTQIPIVYDTKFVPLFSAVKHISAQDIYALTSLPQANISLKDGFAISKNQTTEVSTGDLLEEGVFAVVPYEEEIPENFEPFYNIKLAGEDIKQGEQLLAQGDYIDASNITPLASQGIQKIKVYERPKISILSIGDNLCPIQKEKTDDEVYNSNGLTFAARILEIGAKIQNIWIAKNSEEDIQNCLEELCSKSDLVITSGGMSRRDAMYSFVKNGKLKKLFHTVQISPAGPTALCLCGTTPVLSLPGLPLSALLGFELLGVPTLKTIKKENLHSRKSLHVKNQKEFTCKDSCTSAIPGYFDGISFLSAPSFGAGMLNVLSKCNGYALIKNRGIIKEGEKIEFFPFRGD